MANAPHIAQGFARPSYRPAGPAKGMDPEMRRMAMLAGAMGTVIALVIGAFALSHHVHRGIPVLSPPPGPIRVKPADPGGLHVADADLDTPDGAEKLAAPAEAPQIGALHATEAKPQPHIAPPLTAAAPAAPAAAAAQPAPLAGSTFVQLAAYESQATAETEWARLAQTMPDLFASRQPDITRSTLAGRTIFRLRTGGFSDMAAATEFCRAVRSKGGDCSIAAF